MKKCILLFIASLSAIITVAQDSTKKKQLLKELKAFQDCYALYTNLKGDYSVVFGYLDSSYFKWNKNPEQKMFRVEYLLNQLEKNDQPNLLEEVKKDFLDFYVRRLNRSYESEIFDKSLRRQGRYKPWQTYPYLIFNDSLIDFSKLELKKTNSGYTIYGKMEPSKDITDYWSVDPSEVIFPRSSLDIDKVISYYYYNYQDTSITSQTFDSFIKNEISQKNKVSPDIDGLVNSNFFMGAFYAGDKVPTLLSLWLSEGLNKLKTLLPPDWKSVVENIRLNYETINQKKLWFKWSNSDLYISPYLVRAIYIKCYNEFPIDIKGLNRSLYTSEDIVVTYQLVKNRFLNNFYFLILHELAHGEFNGKEKNDMIEELCDCKAIEIIKQNNLIEKLGAFEDILIQVIKESKREFWEIESENKIFERLKLLKDDGNKLISQDCNKYIK